MSLYVFLYIFISVLVILMHLVKYIWEMFQLD